MPALRVENNFSSNWNIEVIIGSLHYWKGKEGRKMVKMFLNSFYNWHCLLNANDRC